MAVNQKFAEELKAHRVAIRKMTQKEASLDSGIPYGTYILAERGVCGRKVEARVKTWMDKPATTQRKERKHAKATA